MRLEEITNTKTVLMVVSWIALSTTLLLFLPNDVLAVLYLDQLVDKLSSIIGLFFILSYALLSTHIAYFLFNKALFAIKDKINIKKAENKVNILDPVERAVLREFFLRSTTVLALPKNEPSIKSLVDANVLEYLGNEQNYAIQDVTAEYKISSQARGLLNRAVLRLPQNSADSNSEEMQSLLKARPRFLINIVPTKPRK